MLHSFRRRTLLGLAGLLGLTLATPAAAEPALWKVSDADSTLYLFGTVHVLRPETQWRNPTLDEALAGSAEVWFEVDPQRLQDPALMGRLVPLMMDLPRPLSTKLSPELKAKFDTVATSLGAVPAQLEPFKPAAAAIALAAAALARDGYSPDSGVEKVLRAGLGETPIKELETAEQQIRFVTDLPDDIQLAMLDASLDDIQDLSRLDRIVEGWAKGDLKTLEEVFLTEMKTEQPEAYEVFVRARNVAWTDALDAELKGAGSDFVAVGALHMVGPHGLPTLLAAKGYTVERVK